MRERSRLRGWWCGVSAMSMSLAMFAMLGWPAQAASGSAAAKAFVDGLYRSYERTGQSPPEDGSVFTPELAGLIARDEAIARRTGEPNQIDYVLLCGCQDDEGLRFTTRVVASTASRVTVRVGLRYRGRATGEPFDLVLTPTRAGWRIADIVTPVERRRESLLVNLRRSLPRSR